MKESKPKSLDLLQGDFSMADEEDISFDYCDVCFLAFGSQEPRLRKNEKTIHLDCLKRLG
jgi:hypothetical protein